MNKQPRLYNVLFPIWLLVFFPQTWFVVIPLNLFVDFSVVYFGLKYLEIEDYKKQTQKVIIKTWIWGFMADIIGTFIMLIPLFIASINNNQLLIDMSSAIMFNPFTNIISLLWTCLSILISALLIYIVNCKFCFKTLNINMEAKKKVAFSLAVFTAPYLFLLPLTLFY